MNRRHADVPSEDIRSDSGFVPRNDIPLVIARLAPASRGNPFLPRENGAYRSYDADLLDAATSLRLEIVDSEFEVLNHDGALGYEPENAFDTDSFGNSILRFSEEKQDAEMVTS
ncbi:MAG: hypothetical protein R6V02_11980, partial [Candidatus Aminicenantes bacterium]